MEFLNKLRKGFIKPMIVRLATVVGAYLLTLGVDAQMAAQVEAGLIAGAVIAVDMLLHRNDA